MFEQFSRTSGLRAMKSLSPNVPNVMIMESQIITWAIDLDIISSIRDLEDRKRHTCSDTFRQLISCLGTGLFNISEEVLKELYYNLEWH